MRSIAGMQLPREKGHKQGAEQDVGGHILLVDASTHARDEYQVNGIGPQNAGHDSSYFQWSPLSVVPEGTTPWA